MAVGCGTKRCAKCETIKATEEFAADSRRADGLFPYCRQCKRAADRRSWARHKARRSAAAKVRYAANPEPAKARSRKRYQQDPARWKAEALAWHRAHPERHAEASRRWQQANLDGLVREATRRRYATRKGAPSIYFTPERLEERAAYYGHGCWICTEPMTEWDHVKPLSKGGWHCLSNLRPICRGCNARKRNIWPFVGLKATA